MQHGDILAEAEAIVEGEAQRHREAEAYAIAIFHLTPGQAVRAVTAYQEAVEAGAAASGLTMKEYVKFLPPHIAWGILGYCAGQIAAHEAHGGE